VLRLGGEAGASELSRVQADVVEGRERRGQLRPRARIDDMTTLWAVLLAAILLAALYATSLYNYLLFHSLAEVFSIVIAGGIFMMAWNTRQFLKNGYLTLFASGVAHYQIVLDAARQPVDYVFLEVNDVFERLTRLSRDDLVGKRVTQVIPGIERGSVDWIPLYSEVALKGQAAHFDHFFEGLRRWFSVTAYCPEPGFFVTVLEDITERKDAEAALRAAQQQLLHANETLEEKVRQRTAQLQETVTDLEHFSYSVVRDMHAPLRAMQSFAGFVLEDAPGPL
jgi:PAS domain S-box-containing protein